MPDFTSYEIGPDGLVRLKRADGTATPGLLPGATVAERQRIDALTPPQPMTPETVPDGIVSAQGPTQTMRLAEELPPGAQGASGGQPEPAPEPAGAGGAPQAPQEPSGQGGGGGAGGASGGASTQPTGGSEGAPLHKVTDGGTTDADRDRATAAALERERGRRAMLGTPGVYDPGGERLVGYTTSRSGGTSTTTLREDERGLPPDVARRVRDRLDQIPGQINALKAMAKKDPKNAAGYRAQANQLAGEYARLQRAYGPVRDGEPSDLAALRDLEGKERRVANLENDAGYVQARAAEENADTVKLIAEQRARDAAERQAFEEKRKQALGDIYGQIEKKRAEYEGADVNPNRMWQNATTGQTVASAIFMGLGAIGNAIAGDRGPNQAMQIMQAAIDQDIQLQIRGIDKKGKELGHLGETYQLAKDRFGSEEAGMLAAQIAAGDVLRAKLERTAAEAGTEAAKLNAQKMIAANEAAQAQRRWALEQQSVGTRAEQVRVDQAGWKGGSGPNYKTAAEAFKNAAELGGDKNASQQVVLGAAGEGKRYNLGKFVEAGEGKQTRETLNILNNALTEARDLKKMSALEKTMDPTQKAVFESRKKRLAENMSKIQGMGVLQKWDDEAAGKIYGSLLAGDNVMDDAERFLMRMGQGYLDQMGAKPSGASGAAAPWPVAGVPQGRPGGR